ncbi:MAG: hypothetical protein Q9Q40_12940 [Acidobacteriota bacterium]|nr:hypothetical protein [Acidobacteriota bacterium]
MIDSGQHTHRWAAMLPALAAVVAALPCLDFQPDDLFIYLRVVDNVLSGRGWGFNPHQNVDVASSGAWLLTLVSLGKVGFGGVRVAQFLSAFFWVVGIICASRLAGCLAGDVRAAWATSLALAADAWTARWLWSGMETGLAVAVVCGAALIRVRAGRGSLVDRLGSLLLAVAPLVRPELALFTFAVVLMEAWRAFRGRESRLAGDLLAGGLVAVAWSVFALRTWGTVLPSTMAAKGSLGAMNIGASEAAARVLVVVASTQLPALLFLPVAAWLWAGEGEARSERAPGRGDLVRVVLLFAVLLLLVYALRHVRVYTRYLLPLTALVVAVGMAGMVAAARRLDGVRGNWLWGGVVAATLAGNLVLATTVVVPRTRAYGRSMQTVVFPLARRLAAETPLDAVIATPNIGALGLLSGRRILDLNGLATPEIVPFKREGAIDRYLALHPPEVLVEIAPEPLRREIPGLALERIGLFRFDGMFVRGPDPMYFTVYRVHRTGPDAQGAP